MTRFFVFALAVIGAGESLADEGLTGVRLRCIPESNAVEIETFISWDGGSNPYPQIDPKTSALLIAGRKDEYFLVPDPLFPAPYVSCDTHQVLDRREIRVSVGHGTLTIMEPGRTLEQFELAKRWSGLGRYLLRSSEPNVWTECIGTPGARLEDFICRPFDPKAPVDMLQTKDGSVFPNDR